jgi:hypothetical protein
MLLKEVEHALPEKEAMTRSRFSILLVILRVKDEFEMLTQFVTVIAGAVRDGSMVNATSVIVKSPTRIDV